MNFYNEIDPFAAAWLRELIAQGHIANGIVDTRSIEDINPAELAQFTQCHFFAGIGGWPLALRLAGWPDDRPAWTGSCPCQSFSAAGKGAGFADERHLWPSFFHLVRECRPVAVFGEQVDAAIRYGWLDLVQSDLEGIGYTFGAATLAAGSFGAPHQRRRVYFVGHAGGAKRQSIADVARGLNTGMEPTEREPLRAGAASGRAVLVADAEPRRLQQHDAQQRTVSERGKGSPAMRLADAETSQAIARSGKAKARTEPQDSDRSRDGRALVRLADTASSRCNRQEQDAKSDSRNEERLRVPGTIGRRGKLADGQGFTNGFWRDADWILRKKWGSDDPEWCPTEPGTFPLAYGVPARVGRLRGYGNAIVPQVAAAFVEAFAVR